MFFVLNFGPRTSLFLSLPLRGGAFGMNCLFLSLSLYISLSLSLNLSLSLPPSLPPYLVVMPSFFLSHSFLPPVPPTVSPLRLLCTSLSLRTPPYVPLLLTALFPPAPSPNSASLRQSSLEAFSNFFSPLSFRLNNSGWPFGQALNAGAISNLLAQVPGVERVAEVALFEADLRNGRRIGDSKEVIPLETDALFLSFRPQIVVR